MLMHIFAVGDVCGRPGLDHLRRTLPGLRKLYQLDFVIVNGENANVVGVTPAQCEEMLDAGADVITLGNHTWTRYELKDYLEHSSRCLRPLNYAPQCPGQGVGVYETPFGPLRVINLLGRFTLDANTDNPFVVVDALLAEEDFPLTFVDFHAEGTSEKRAMGFFLEGRVSAIWGTHTHVQTSDCQVLTGGTGYITDLGMTGASDSVLGMNKTIIVNRFRTGIPQKFELAQGKGQLCGAIFTVDENTGKCSDVERVWLDE